MSTMSSRSDLTTDGVHIYRLKWWRSLLNVFSLGVIWVIIGIPLALLIILVVPFLQSDPDLRMAGAGIMCMMLPVIAGMSLLLVMMTMSVIMSFFAYIKITPDGLEQRVLLYKHIRCSWADVDRIEKYFFLNDLLYVTAFEIIGPSISLAMPFKLLQHPQASIALSGYTGWPDGQLAEDLKWGAPQLFQNWPVTQRALSSSQPHSSGLSQEERLLAALSHASIVFQMIGIVVPIVIWATQKKKSAYASFQALQAAVWQGIALAFGMIVPVCMTSIILVPIFMAVGSQQDSSALGEASFGWTIFTVMAVSLVVILANAIFWIYGIVGAVMAYQGEDFRYAIIGNRLGKSGLSSTQQTGAGP